MKHFLIASAALLPAWSAASAQDGDELRVRVGLGAQVRPDFIGADSSEVAPLWRVNVARGTDPFKFSAPDYSFGIPMISSGGFSVGPAANIASGRKNSDLDVSVGKVKTTIEAGAFASYQLTESLYLRAEALKGLGGHDGVVGTVGADQIWRDGDRYVFSIGPRILFSESRYQRSFFGVSPEAALASGLPTYRPGGGVHAVAAASSFSYQFDPRWGVFGYGRYERLVGDAAKSPIVRELGSRNQLSGGIGLSYTFTMKR